MSAPSTRVRRWTVRGLAATFLAALAGGFLIAALAWHVTGGRWQIVSTPSMGQAAPVGTLMLTRPTHVADLHVGDVITYHPPTEPAKSYTHRIVRIADGAVHTQGDINGSADPWAIHDKDIVGKVTVRWWGIGWLLRGLPFLLIGGLVVWAATRWYADDRWRGPARVFGFSFVFAIAAYIVKPFVRVVTIATTGDGNGAHATVVSTGLLPIRVSTPKGTHADLVAGQVGVVTAPAHAGGGGYQLASGLHMPWTWWLVIIGVCSIPLLYTVIVGLAPLDEPPSAAAQPAGADESDDSRAEAASTTSVPVPA